MNLKSKATKNIKNKIKKVLWHLLKPFLPFILLIVAIILLVSYFLDGIFIQTAQADSSNLEQEELDLKNICIEKVDELNTCNNFLDNTETNKLLDLDDRENLKLLQWSHLYTIVTLSNLEDGKEYTKTLVDNIGKNFISTFKYQTIKVKTEKFQDENWVETESQDAYILVESNTIYGHYTYSYKDTTNYFDDSNTKITTKEFVEEKLEGDKYSMLKSYLKDKLKIDDEDMDTYIDLVINSSTGYYDESNFQGDNNFVGVGMFIWPIPNYTTITSYYGYRTHPITGQYKLHSGVDVGAPIGTDFVAMADGTISTASYVSGYGNTVIINHGNGISTLYAHGSQLLVKTNQYVTKGTPVLKVGSTGNSTGPHAHFEVRINNKCVNPLDYFERSK